MSTLEIAGAAMNRDFPLVDQCLRGDAAAWETMVQSYGARIRRMARKYRDFRNDADDLTQEVFVRVYCHLNSYRADSGSFENWVVRVGRNLLIDHLRASRRRQQLGGSDELDDTKLKDRRGIPADSWVEKNESAEAIRKGLESLPLELREVVVMRYLEGVSYQEMAERLGVPEGTIKSRINRGRAKLANYVARRRS